MIFLPCYRLLTLVTVGFLSSVSFGQLNTSSANPNRDAQIKSGALFTNVNYGTNVNTEVQVGSATVHSRFLVQFDTAGFGIPSYAIIYSAKLKLRPTTAVGEGADVTSSSFVVKGVTASWAETTVKDNNQPSTTSANQVTTSSLTSGRRVFDVTNLVKDWYSGALSLNGLLVMRNQETTATNANEYDTKDDATSSERPILEVQWYRPMYISAATVVQASTLSATDGSISPTITWGSGSFTYQWYNLVSGTPTAISGATSINLTSKAAGWYGLKVTGTAGDIYYMSFIIGAKCELLTLNFPQDPNYIDNAQVRSGGGFQTTNYGTGTTVEAGGASTSDYRFFLRYRLWFDGNNYFYNATQTLKGSAHSTGTNACNLYRTTAEWDESVITWTNQPAVNTSTPTGVALPTTASTTENKTLDVTSYFQYWTTNPTANYGYRVSGTVSSPTVGNQVYHSDDATTSTNRPYVTLIVDDNTCDRTSAYSFKPVLDGSYVPTYKSKLKVQFTEEYQQSPGKKWPVVVYDYNRAVKAAITYDGGTVSGSPYLFQSVDYVFGDNRATLDLSGYSLTNGGYYILELIKSTGEKEYIEFIYKN